MLGIATRFEMVADSSNSGRVFTHSPTRLRLNTYVVNFYYVFIFLLCLHQPYICESSIPGWFVDCIASCLKHDYSLTFSVAHITSRSFILFTDLYSYIDAAGLL